MGFVAFRWLVVGCDALRQASVGFPGFLLVVLVSGRCDIQCLDCGWW